MKKITFATNTGANTLEYTKLLLKSLKDNLDRDDHEILVFVDNDNDGTVDYLREVKKDFKDFKIVTHKVKPLLGHQRNSNIIVELAKYDIISYLQSDMVVSNHYDTNVINNLEEDTILSSTRIEPPLHGVSSVTFTKNFGFNPQEFDYRGFLNFAESNKHQKIVNYFFAPYTFHKKTWEKVGGYDTIFRRSREDSDFVQRCIHAGIKLKQTFAANVYHFTCVSSRGKDWFNKSNQDAQSRVAVQNLADQIELRRFIRKWGGFNHGEGLLEKYDADLVIKDVTPKDIPAIAQIEPYFSRVWIDSEEALTDIKNLLKHEQEPANALLNFDQLDWEASKKYYNQTNYDSIFNLGIPKNWNVKVEMSSKELNGFIVNANQIHELIKQTEVGTYEMESGNVVIDIKSTVKLPVDIKVKNPDFGADLLAIE